MTASLLIGLAVALTLWQLMVIVNGVPKTERHYRDKPPLGFRAIWPLVEVLACCLRGLVSEKRLESLEIRLIRAGAAYRLSALELMAGKFVTALLFTVMIAPVTVPYGWSALPLSIAAGFCGFCYPDSWLRRQAKIRRQSVLRVLPYYLDIITLSVESGSNLTGGMTQVVQKSTDSPLRDEFSRVLRDIRSGQTRADALRAMARRVDSPVLNQVVSGLIQSEKSGANLGPTLRAQAQQLRTQRFQRAEKKAMQAPVKLLGPLFICIFPMTFIALGFLMISKMIIGGIVTSPFLLWAYHWPYY